MRPTSSVTRGPSSAFWKTAWLLCLASGLLATRAAAAEQSSPQDNSPADQQASAVRVDVTPAPEPTPALRYRLLPIVPDLRPGNARTMYARLGMEQADGYRERLRKADDWFTPPLSELPREEVRGYLSIFERKFEGLALAALRKEHDWTYPIGEVPALEILLPDVQELRLYGRLLALKARLEILDGRYDDAIQTLHDGFALARHISHGPFLIHQMVAVAVARMMADRVEELIAQPGAPNLYWALTTLPTPLVDIRQSVELEQRMLELSVPGIDDLDRLRSEDEWKELLLALLDLKFDMSAASTIRISPRSEAWEDRLELVRFISQTYPSAKRFLIETENRDPNDVDRMPIAQVLVLRMMAPYEPHRDNVFKWASVPVHQALPHMAALREESIAAADDPLADLAILGVISNVPDLFAIPVVLERHLAALRVIEALRMYAEANDGRLPDRLEQVTQVPIPDDPLLGKPFRYVVQDGEAELTADSVQIHLWQTTQHEQLNYKIRIRDPSQREAPER